MTDISQLWINCFVARTLLPVPTPLKLNARVHPFTPSLFFYPMRHRPLLRLHSKKGFALVLSLAIMTMLLLITISLAAFLTIELGSSRSFLLRKRAQLNAQVALRIALGQLQQETGPDRRVTAQANITLPGNSAASLKNKWADRNPYWTGAWDTQNPDDRPPAWLVSGPRQVSLAGKTSYPSEYQTPWTMLSPDDIENITLFSSVANLDADAPFDTRVTVPRVALRDTINGRSGHYAYWIGDEGVKARLNLNSAHSSTTNTLTTKLGQLISPGFSSPELFASDWTNVDKEELPHALTSASFALLDGMPQNLSIPAVSHAITPYSQGVMADVVSGGLKQDLSLAFEMSDADFNNSPFVKGNGRLTLNLIGTQNVTGLASDPQWQSVAMEIPELNTVRTAAPVFNVTLSGGKNLRGPTWEILRDYYGLYKEFGKNENGVLLARSYYPNTRTANNIINYTYTYNLVYIGETGSANIGNTTCAYTDDKITWKGQSVTTIRPTKVSAMPSLSRLIMTYALQKELVGQDTYRLRLVINPIVVMHNPYNIPIRFKGRYINSVDQKAGYRLAFRPADDGTWSNSQNRYDIKIDYKDVDASGKYINYELKCNLRSMMGSTGNDNDDPFKIFVPDVVFQPGEFRVFTHNANEPSEFKRAIMLEGNYYYKGGFYMDLKGLNESNPRTFSPKARISVTMIPKDISVAELMESINTNPSDPSEDDISYKTGLNDKATNKKDFQKMTYHRELNFSDDNNNPTKTDLVGKIDIVNLGSIANIPTSGSPPRLIGMSEFFIKPTEWDMIDSNLESKFNNNRYPVYVLSNPLSTSHRTRVNGRNTTNPGFAIASPSWQTRLSKATDWADFFECDGNTGLSFGGNNLGSSGQTKSVVAMLPLAPLSSLGQFQSANINVVDTLPLLAAGNSFPSPFVEKGGVFYTNNYWTNYDFSWLFNTALWDHFYFSTIAPQGNSSSGKWVDTYTQKQTWENLLYNNVPLANSRLVVSPSASRATAANLLDNVATNQSWRKSAAYLLQKGTFNINTVDSRSWKTILGSTFKSKVPKMDSTDELANDEAAVFSRALPTVADAFATGNESSSSRWNGVIALVTEKLTDFSKALQGKIIERLASTHNKVNYTTPTGEALARPFFSLAEFINRVPGDDPYGKSGLMQAAIAQASLNQGIDSKKMDSDWLNNPTQGKFPYPDAVSNSASGNMPIASGASGYLLQGDVFQAIGPFLNVRSDTFTIRTYGDVSTPDGKQILARAWLEAVVQRTPEYMDSSQPAWTAPTNDPDGVSLSTLNQLLGRRYHVVSVRWLSPSEI